MPTAIYTFTIPANYALDNAEIDGGKGKIACSCIIIGGGTFYASYKTGIDASISDGSPVGVSFGGAAVAGDKLDLAHDDIRYVDYDAALNADAQQTGCIRFKVTPNYSVGPTSEGWFFTITKAHHDIDNMIGMRHSAGGHLRLHVYSDTGALITEIYLGTYSMTQGQAYEIEVNYDLTAGAIRVFVDGIQVGSTSTATGTRDALIGLLRIGTNYKVQYKSNFSIDDFVVFPTVQHTANYTPGGRIVGYGEGKILANSAIQSDSISAFDSTEDLKTGSSIGYALKVGSSLKYWSGAAWVDSDGSESQTNTLAEIQANIATLLSSGQYVRPYAFLRSNVAHDETPEIDDVMLVYNFEAAEPVFPDTCMVFGWLKDPSGAAIDGAIIALSLYRSGYEKEHFEGDAFVLAGPVTVTTDSAGYFEIALLPSTSIEGTANQYRFTATKAGADIFHLSAEPILITVPEEASRNITDLITAT